MSRSWGPWTEVKLDALSNYLKAFTTASSKARGTLYLDLFAGAPENRSRRDERSIIGSPVLAASTMPPFTRMVLCELQPKSAEKLRALMETQYPGRDISVLIGDCNETIPAWLSRQEPGWRLAPAFAFLDQYAAEISWSTIRALAQFKDEARTKAELWMLFADGLIPRGAYGDADGPILENFAARLDAMFGTSRWRELHRGRAEGLLTAGEFRAELVNLMRWRLERELGYKTTLPLSFVNEHGTPIYTMIFATDHDVGKKIMRSVFTGAEGALVEMRARATQRRKRERDDELGIVALFEEPLRMPDQAPLSETFSAPREPWLYPGD